LDLKSDKIGRGKYGWLFQVLLFGFSPHFHQPFHLIIFSLDARACMLGILFCFRGTNASGFELYWFDWIQYHI